MGRFKAIFNKENPPCQPFLDKRGKKPYTMETMAPLLRNPARPAAGLRVSGRFHAAG